MTSRTTSFEPQKGDQCEVKGCTTKWRYRLCAQHGVRTTLDGDRARYVMAMVILQSDIWESADEELRSTVSSSLPTGVSGHVVVTKEQAKHANGIPEGDG